jgi:flagellar biogenesis protein FliO
VIAFILTAAMAQPVAGQRLERVELVRTRRGSNLVLTFRKPVHRGSIPVVPYKRNLVLHLPGAIARPLAGNRRAIGMVRTVAIGNRRLVVRLKRLGRGVADQALVSAKGRRWFLKMSDDTAGRDLADVLVGSPAAAETPPFDAFKVSEQRKTRKAELEDASAAAGGVVVLAAIKGADPEASTPAAAGGDTPPVSSPPKGPEDGGDLGSTVRMGAGLALVLFGAMGLLWWRRRDRKLEEAFGLRVVSRVRLDGKSSVAVLEVGGAVLVVGLSDQGPRLLTRFDDGETMGGGDPTVDDDEVDRLRALVSRGDAASTLGAWAASAQRPDAFVDPLHQASPSAAAPAQEVSAGERADLRKRLAEIRMKNG